MEEVLDDFGRNKDYCDVPGQLEGGDNSQNFCEDAKCNDEKGTHELYTYICIHVL